MLWLKFRILYFTNMKNLSWRMKNTKGKLTKRKTEKKSKLKQFTWMVVSIKKSRKDSHSLTKVTSKSWPFTATPWNVPLMKTQSHSFVKWPDWPNFAFTGLTGCRKYWQKNLFRVFPSFKSLFYVNYRILTQKLRTKLYQNCQTWKDSIMQVITWKTSIKWKKTWSFWLTLWALQQNLLHCSFCQN